jgi:transmembrane sensor
MATHKNKEAPGPDSKRVRFVSKRAALWYFRNMDKPAMDLPDRQRFLNWLRRSPDNVSEFLAFLYIDGWLDEHKLHTVESDEASINALDAASNTNEASATIESLDNRRDDRHNGKIDRKTGQLWKIAAAAAGMTLTMLLAIAISESRLDTVSTAAGQHQHMTLSDGSVTHLAANTRLKIEFSGEQRVVHLHQGEAVFTVAKDSARPFTVTTALVDVTAVGTRFGVSMDQDVLVIVSEGVVRITAHGNPDDAEVTILRAGEQLRVFGGTLIQHKVALVDAARTLQWADGWLEFKSGQTIGEAAREFNRHNIEQIEIEQPAIAARELQGPYRFTVDSSAVFARTIAANNDLALIEDRTGKVLRLRLVERRQ